MPNDMNANEWKLFLNARIQQEKGDDEGALAIFDELLANHPRNEHLLSSRAFAFSRLGRADDAQVAAIAAAYTEAGKNLSGEKDDPEAWVARLGGLLEDLDQGPEINMTAHSAIAW